MELYELNLKHYGKFKEHTIRLSPGINILYGKNESGKSTVHSFVRAMLFGFARVRGKSAGTEEYFIRQPWEYPAYYEGSMRLIDGKNQYRIDRNFCRGQESVCFTWENKGTQALDAAEGIRNLLGGMNEQAFCQTVYVSQDSIVTEKNLIDEICSHISSEEGAKENKTDAARAIESLKKRKRKYEQLRKKEEQILEEQITKRQTEADYIRKEMEQLKQNERRIHQEAERNREQNEEEEEQSHPVFSWLLRGLLLLAALLSFAGAWFLRKILFAGLGGVFLILQLPLALLLSRWEDEDEEEEPELEEEFRWRMDKIAEEIQNRQEAYQKLQNELEILYQKHVKMEGSALEIQAVSLAIEKIESLSEDLRKESGHSLQMRMSEIMQQLSGGNYQRVCFDENMGLRLQTPERLLTMQEISSATARQLMFAFRIAAGEVLSNGKKLPLLLDEPFVMYDEERLEAVMRWLYESKRQVILFTCQDRERRILEKIKKE